MFFFHTAAVLVGSRRGARVLRDEDSTSVVVRSRKRLNTLAHYQVADGASLALQARQLYASSTKNGTVKQQNGMQCNRSDRLCFVYSLLMFFKIVLVFLCKVAR